MSKSPASTSRSPVRGTSSSPKRPRSVGTEDDELAEIRRQKHNALEVNRRKRINDKFKELHSLVATPLPDRAVVLQGAVDTIIHYEKSLLALQAKALANPSTAGLASDISAMLPDRLGNSIGFFVRTEETPVAAITLETEVGFDFNRIFGQTSAPMALMGLRGEFLNFNDAFVNLLGQPRDDLLRKNMFEVVNTTDIARMTSKVRALANGVDDLVVFDTFLMHGVQGQVPLVVLVYSVKSKETPDKVESLMWIGVKIVSQGT